MSDHIHQWYPWQVVGDQLGNIVPDENGIAWHYRRECSLLGCPVWEYAQMLLPAGPTKLVYNDY